MASLRHVIGSNSELAVATDMATVVIDGLTELQQTTVKLGHAVQHQIIIFYCSASTTGGTLRVANHSGILLHSYPLSHERISGPFLLDVYHSSPYTRERPLVEIFGQPRVSVAPSVTGEMPMTLGTLEFGRLAARMVTKAAMQDTLTAEFATQAEYDAMVTEVNKLPLRSSMAAKATWDSVAAVQVSIAAQSIEPSELVALSRKDYVHPDDMHMFNSPFAGISAYETIRAGL